LLVWGYAGGIVSPHKNLTNKKKRKKEKKTNKPPTDPPQKKKKTPTTLPDKVRVLDLVCAVGEIPRGGIEDSKKQISFKREARICLAANCTRGVKECGGKLPWKFWP